MSFSASVSPSITRTSEEVTGCALTIATTKMAKNAEHRGRNQPAIAK